MRMHRRPALAAAALLAAVTACNSATTGGGAAPAGGQAHQITLYTAADQDTVTAVVSGFEKTDPGAKVSVFRATTGQLNARITADQRSGGLRADVIWGADPLSMEAWAEQGLFRPWPLPALASVPGQFRARYFWGTGLEILVMVAHKGLVPLPRTWTALTSSRYRGTVAIPDPANAGTAFAALGYFDQAPRFGMAFYRALKANGAVQVATPPEVVTDVAEGRYQVGITLYTEVLAALQEGSPVTADWPEDGAIGVYGPIGETVTAGRSIGVSATSSALIRYVLSRAGQRDIGATGAEPVLPGVPGQPRPAGAALVYPVWASLFGRQDQILQQYQAIFGA